MAIDIFEQTFGYLDRVVSDGSVIMLRYDRSRRGYTAETFVGNRQEVSTDHLFDALRELALVWHRLPQRTLPASLGIDSQDTRWCNELERMIIQGLCLTVYRVGNDFCALLLGHGRGRIKQRGTGGDVWDAVDAILHEHRCGPYQ